MKILNGYWMQNLGSSMLVHPETLMTRNIGFGIGHNNGPAYGKQMKTILIYPMMATKE
jgi:hypothetical protein